MSLLCPARSEPSAAYPTASIHREDTRQQIHGTVDVLLTHEKSLDATG